MGLVTWILAGAVLGGAASALIGIENLKWLVLNVVTGVAGVLGGGWLLGLLIEASVVNSGDFGLAGLLVSLIVAAILIAVLQLSRDTKNGPPARPGAASSAFDSRAAYINKARQPR